MLTSQPRKLAPKRRSRKWRRDVVELGAAPTPSSIVIFYSPPKLISSFYSARGRRDLEEQKFNSEQTVATTNTCASPRRPCDYRVQRARLDRGRAQGHRPRTRRTHWSFGSHR